MKTLFLLLLLCVSIATPGYAEQYRLTDEMAAYNQGDYRQAIGIGQLLAAQDADNATVHYFLANSYSHLNEPEQAQKQYLLCEKLTDDLQMRAYCDQALSRQNHRVTDEANSLIIGEASAIHILASPRGERLIAEAREQILQEQEAMDNQATKDSERKIAEIQMQANRDIAAVPQFIYVTAKRSEPNPDYSLNASKINKDADSKIAALQTNLDKDKRNIRLFFEQKLMALNSSIAGIYSQAREGLNSLQLAPGSAQLYIKDYLNFEVPKPIPLPASTAKCASGPQINL